MVLHLLPEDASEAVALHHDFNSIRPKLGPCDLGNELLDQLVTDELMELIEYPGVPFVSILDKHEQGLDLAISHFVLVPVTEVGDADGWQADCEKLRKVEVNLVEDVVK